MHASHQLVRTARGRGGVAPERHHQAAYQQNAVKKDRASKTHQEAGRGLVNQFTTCLMEQPGPSSSTISWNSYKNRVRKVLYKRWTKAKMLAQASLSISTVAVRITLRADTANNNPTKFKFPTLYRDVVWKKWCPRLRLMRNLSKESTFQKMESHSGIKSHLNSSILNKSRVQKWVNLELRTKKIFKLISHLRTLKSKYHH